MIGVLKKFVNTTIGTSDAKALDAMIKDNQKLIKQIDLVNNVCTFGNEGYGYKDTETLNSIIEDKPAFAFQNKKFLDVLGTLNLDSSISLKLFLISIGKDENWVSSYSQLANSSSKLRELSEEQLKKILKVQAFKNALDNSSLIQRRTVGSNYTGGALVHTGLSICLKGVYKTDRSLDSGPREVRTRLDSGSTSIGTSYQEQTSYFYGLFRNLTAELYNNNYYKVELFYIPIR